MLGLGGSRGGAKFKKNISIIKQRDKSGYLRQRKRHSIPMPSEIRTQGG
jgi:hypothetical protein